MLVLLRSRMTLATGVATIVALASALNSAEHMWRSLERSYDVYSANSELERRHAPLAGLLPGEVFDFYAQFLVPGDRIYYQVLESPLGQFIDLPTAVRYAGHLYLLPAVEARDLDDATVVVTFFADPAELDRRFLTQRQAGLQPIYVSRISVP